MRSKLSAYWHTAKNMKPSQLLFRISKKLHLKCDLGVQPSPYRGQYYAVPTVPELDFDPSFLLRFPAEELMAGKVMFLNHKQILDPYDAWDDPKQSPLWNFNLHYFEFLFPLIQAYQQSENTAYLYKIKDLISGWISQNPQRKKGNGWKPYTAAVRLANWLSCFSYLERSFAEDEKFKNKLLSSIYEQFYFLATHLEKDILANHYFEDLKALVLCSLFFDDKHMLKASIQALKKQCTEQILSDGMHFELSPMYHKIILEGLIRVAAALQARGIAILDLEEVIKRMVYVAYSLEAGLQRLPLFNDCGSNVAKSLDALLRAGENHFQIVPVFQDYLPAAGYYIFRNGPWTLIVDAGSPGAQYTPGHAHCDAMSFELFKNGIPVLVNCGTYAYQSDLRTFFRSTSAHNTVMVNDVEQSQCWGIFRMGKRSAVRVLNRSQHGLTMEMRDQKNQVVRRTLLLADNQLTVSDHAKGHKLTANYHLLGNTTETANGLWTNEHAGLCRVVAEKCCFSSHPYAEEYGKLSEAGVIELEGMDALHFSISF